jgi:phosphohistidine swiveling domain-containing protein
MKYLVSLHTARPPDCIGNKALNLHWLWQKKFNIPRTYICTWNAYLDYQRLGSVVVDSLLKELEQTISPGRSYAVRSSANLEDSAYQSFAGQFTSLLNVRGASLIAQAIKSVWDTAQTETVQIYLQRSAQPAPKLLMAVIVQEMIEPVLSGVSFSRNPITGMEETIVEAVRGAGTQLVQSGITPMRWVSRWGTLMEKPGGEQLPDGLIEQIVQQTNQIAHRLRRDIDLEWVYDGQTLYWVQLRDITALWEGDVYNNQIAREMMPGLIKPLVWSVSSPIHARQWVRILNELVGDTHIQAQRLVKAFHYRAYFNMGQFGRVFASLGMPPDSLERMMGVLPPGASRPKFMPGISFLPKAPRVIYFVLDKLRFGSRVEREYAIFRREARAFSGPRTADDSPSDLLERVDQIVRLQEKVSYNTILSILLMQIYNALLHRHLKARGVDPSQFDFTDQWESLQAYDPNLHLADLYHRYQALEPQYRVLLSQGDLKALHQEAGLSDFCKHFDQFLDRFGHMSDSTVDFTSVPWRESPDLILRLVCEFTPREMKPVRKIGLQDLKCRRLSFRYLCFTYQRARQFRLYREMYSSLYTYTLMLLRDHFHALGERLIVEGLLSSWQDIFFLYLEELHNWVNGASDGKDLAALVAERKDEMELSRNALIPDVIYGDAIPPLIPAHADKLQGIPTSRGYYAGRVKVVHGLNDFQKLEQGDVLVIPYSDVGWTPLFARAGAVIAESGGILSHSSIIAREYNIPAVVSVKAAMNLPDGALVEVDGYKGLVYLKDGSKPTSAGEKGGIHASSTSG